MVNIIVNSDPKYKIDKLSIQSVVLEVLQTHQVPGKVEIGINIVSNRKIHQFNKKYRGVDSPTNILSFALEDLSMQSLQHIPRVGFFASSDKVTRLGDILISYPQAAEDASLEGVTVEDELRYLVEHGVKHLLGIHHN